MADDCCLPQRPSAANSYYNPLAILIIKMDKSIFLKVHKSPQVAGGKKTWLYIDLGTVRLQNDFISRISGGWVNGADCRHCL